MFELATWSEIIDLQPWGVWSLVLWLHARNTQKKNIECPVNALRAQNLAGGHFLGHEIRLVFVSLSI